MTDFSRNANSGCFSGMLGRISCYRSLPTHPTDINVIDSKAILDKSVNQKKINLTAEAKVKGPAGPGVVARLMGLDSLPETDWVPGKGTSDSLVRSRSVSFADYMLQLDISQTQHRRVRTSVSFREVPTLSHQQNRDLLVVYLDNVDQTKGKGTKVRKCERDCGDLKQRKVEQGSKKKENKRERANSVKKEKKKMENQENNRISMLRNEPRRVVSTNLSNRNTTGAAKRLSSLPTRKKNVDRTDVADLKEKSPLKPRNQKKLPVEAKPKRNRKARAGLAAEVLERDECDSQNSSPIYLLEVNDSGMQQGAQRPMEFMNLNRTSSPKLVSYTDDLRIGAIKDSDNQMDISATKYYVDVVEKLFRLTETDIEESNWLAKNSHGFEGFEEVGEELERHIFDVLLNQVVDELVEIPFEILVQIMLEEANNNWL